MSVWAWPVIAFAALLIVPAIYRRRPLLALSFVAVAALAAALATVTAPAVRFAAPLLLLLLAYWSTGPFYTAPSPRLEAWLMQWDDIIDADGLSARAPGWVRLLVEIAYIGCYPFMIAASIPAFRQSHDAFAWHWTLVLAAELMCYVTLPWLQARPPRELRNSSRLNFPGSTNRENSTGKNLQNLRAVNHAILARLSVRATTIPSGHVAGPLAAAASAWTIAPDWGPWLLLGAVTISAATVLGRYHYAIDAVLGIAAGLLPPAVRAWWL